MTDNKPEPSIFNPEHLDDESYRILHENKWSLFVTEKDKPEPPMTAAAKGPTKVEVAHYEDGLLDGWNFIRYVGGETIAHVNGGDREKEHTEFIVDAFNVYAETGLTPREMMEERDRMLGLLRDSLDTLVEEWGNCGGGTPEHQKDCTQCGIRSALSPEKKEPKQ